MPADRHANPIFAAAGGQVLLCRTTEKDALRLRDTPCASDTPASPKAVVDLCKAVETRAVEGLGEGQILATVSNGYQCGDRVLRPTEIIAVANRT
jgi:hypothetical protein